MRRSPNSSVKQACARWGCKKAATYEKPLCYNHWIEWERWGLEECMRCHWFYGDEETQFLFGITDAPPYVGTDGILHDPAFLCDICWFQSSPDKEGQRGYLRGMKDMIDKLQRLEPESERKSPWGSQRQNVEARLAEMRTTRPVAAHADITRPIRWVYVIKLDDGAFYVGQTDDLPVRMQEHRDGRQHQTRGKDGKLVYYECFEGDREAVTARENELTLWNQDGFGQRRLRQLIESWRAPLRLLDLNA